MKKQPIMIMPGTCPFCHDGDLFVRYKNTSLCKCVECGKICRKPLLVALIPMPLYSAELYTDCLHNGYGTALQLQPALTDLTTAHFQDGEIVQSLTCTFIVKRYYRLPVFLFWEWYTLPGNYAMLHEAVDGYAYKLTRIDIANDIGGSKKFESTPKASGFYGPDGGVPANGEKQDDVLEVNQQKGAGNG